jgi:gamma-glutamyltranspeptidase/glutathione hydrolase
MGGEGQPQTQAALVTRIVDRGLDPQAAVEAPRWLFGRTWGEETRSLRLEDRFDDDVRNALRERGHEVEIVEGWSDLMGHAQVIRLDSTGSPARRIHAPTAPRSASSSAAARARRP